MLLVLPLAGVALAAPPSGGFLNPDITAADGPFNVISDKADGTDGLYHFVVRVNPNDGGQTITSVSIQIEDGDSDALFETIGAATQVGSSDTWEFKWDIGAYTPATDVDNDLGTVRAVVADSGGETANIDVAATFSDSSGETVEITSVANGAALGFFGSPSAATVSGTGSSGVNAAGEVDLFYTNSANTVADPVWVACGEAAGVVTAPATTATWTGTCTLAGAETGALVTGIAARADTATENDDGELLESGDAHRVSGYAQSAAGSSVTITPASDSQTFGFCNTYTVNVLDTLNNPILGANVDVHAVGPNDNLQFAWNLDDSLSTTDSVSDNGATSHAPVTHTVTTSSAPEQAIAECDGTVTTTFVEAPDGDGIGDDKDADDASDGDCTGVEERGCQGNHANATGNDTKHYEGNTDGNGFQFSIDSDAVGTTNITAWFDDDGDELVTAGEPTATASKTWVAAAATNVDASPEQDLNVIATEHVIDAVVTDQNGNPMGSQVVRFRVVSGPHADNDMDGDISTPLGYIGQCTTDTDGTCDSSGSGADGDGYTGSEEGDDTVAVFVNSAGESGAAVFAADGDDAQDPGGVGKTWFDAPDNACLDLDPNTDANATTATHTLVAFVTDGTFDLGDDASDDPGQIDNDCSGSPLSGVAVDFSIVDDDPDGALSPDNNGDENTERVGTNASGQATVTLDNKNDSAGINTFSADVVGVAAGNDGETNSKQWVAPGAPFELDCEPELDMNAVGTNHTMVATVTDVNGAPLSGIPVDMHMDGGTHTNNDLDSDPTTPLGTFVDNELTNASGQVTGSYPGSEVTTDDIHCFVDADDSDLGSGPPDEPEDFATKHWRTAAVIAGADVEIDKEPTGGGPDESEPGTTNTQTCDADTSNLASATWNPTATEDVNSVNLVCVSATTRTASGDVLNGATVTLASSGVGFLVDDDGSNPTTSKSAVIDGNYAEFYVLSTTKGDQTLTATIQGVTDTDTATDTWEVDNSEARIIDCEPETDTNPPGSDHEIVCTVTDGFGNGVGPGAPVTWTKTDSGGASSAFLDQQTATDANGVARSTIRSSTNGATSVTGSLPSASTECENAAGAPHTGTAGPGTGSWDTNKPAGVCSDEVTKTWSAAPPPPPPPPPPGPGVGQGYWFVASDGGIFTFGAAQFFGSTGAINLNSPIVGMDSFPTGEGYWMFARDGGVFAFGKSQFFGSTGSLVLNRPVVGGAATPSGGGYYEVASDGGIFAFGDAQFFGSTGSLVLNSPIVAMSVTPTGKGYHLYARDGGVFAFGDAAFHGSTGSLKLNSPITGADNTLSGGGYWEVAADGGIFSFGNAQFFGSTGSLKLNSPIAGMSGTPSDQGYWFVGGDGGIFAFGNAAFHGSTGSLVLNRPIVGMEGLFS